MFSAVLDTSVLYPSLLRDVLLELAWEKVYRPVWSDRILQELDAVIRRRHSHQTDMDVDSYITRLISRMNKAFPDALTADVRELELDLPDPKDVHVVACAEAGHAEAIITRNLKDFPPAALPQDIRAIPPDAFLLDSLDMNPQLFAQALGAIASRSGRHGLPISAFNDLVVHLDRKWCPGLRLTLSEHGF
ncbi:toxin-antitoxin system, toxin component, PIN family [Mobiluncus mulieris ATCC 35239]|uniref:Toxin-antitoxin system, toxin component, PIN family n=2 Tax=Mobiluncus mulieris TaxID=2052 RepID=E0QPK4_9ACTO|nr:PIN domain-containing protein [Mobiluncus mulieris]EEJ54856.1 toxin-antitoxin system, toxin component, PIN family [Mobiluncus mulieris ATCC 35243]EFM46504.1 toxin-antitoxin system, toxin component, PIN family [Mobiluncus mulieris ATCC 35239]MCU9972232.1 PIN domain-containing protein [Mobiluncus mulieris]MCU9995218.1 PIN domain-containing protein [Mobiluncus mulieris]MCV0003538.1 PIN domain-containing protein [Mobiluncus mulieris]